MNSLKYFYVQYYPYKIYFELHEDNKYHPYYVINYVLKQELYNKVGKCIVQNIIDQRNPLHKFDCELTIKQLTRLLDWHKDVRLYKMDKPLNIYEQILGDKFEDYL